MVTRLSNADCKDAYSKCWWPDCDTKMTFVNNLTKPSSIHRYVLHARHRSAIDDRVTLEHLFGENLERYKEEAENAFKL